MIKLNCKRCPCIQQRTNHARQHDCGECEGCKPSRTENPEEWAKWVLGFPHTTSLTYEAIRILERR